MKIEILDGKDCIGGSKILVTNKYYSILLDFGINFNLWGNYFEEFLQPRTSTGIYDLWKLNLIPKISNIYRDDLIISDFKEIVEKERVIDLKTIFLSHAHLDHSGFISLLKEDIQIVTSRVTKKLLKAMEETGDGKVFSQFTLVKKRVEDKDEYGEKKLKSGKDKFERNFFEIEELNFEGEFEGIKFKSFSVDHSIPGALAFYIELGDRSIVYTGDIRFHGKNSDLSYKFIENVKKLKPDILITEGTRMDKIDEKPRKEIDVYYSSLDVVLKYKGKFVIADFGPRNIERLETFLNIAKESGRKLIVNIKDAYLLYLLKEENFKIIDDDSLYIIIEKRMRDKSYVKEVKGNLGNKIITMDDLKKNIGDFIICYSYWDLVNLLDIDIEDGAYIYSSSEAYTEEQKFDTKRLLNWLKFLNLKPFGIELNFDEPHFSGDYHSSGHASFLDLIYMIDEINPKYIIPVHTESIKNFKERFKEKVIDSSIFEL